MWSNLFVRALLEMAEANAHRNDSLRNDIEGVLQKYDSGCLRLTDASIDRLLGIHSTAVEKQLDIGELLLRYGNHRLAKGDFSYSIIRRLYCMLQPYLEKRDTLLDLGCGYGRIAFYGGLLKKGRVVGIEIIKERAIEAERVRRQLGLRSVEIVVGDASKSVWPPCSCICLMNSVAPRVLSRIGRRIKEIARKRKIVVASHSNSNLFFERQVWMREIGTKPSRWTFDLRLFESMPC